MKISDASRTPDIQKTQDDATRRIALIAGIFFLITFVHVAILPLYDEVLNNPAFVRSLEESGFLADARRKLR